MKSVKALGLLVAVLLAVPAVSTAQQLAYTSKGVNLRAGPARDYPVVAVLPPGLAISVVGCVSGYAWCDVLAGQNRGWLYAGNIVYPYQGANVPVLSYGAVIGIGIIGFNLGNYWDHYYRGRPWYPQRQRWIDRPRPVFSPRGGPRPPQVQRPGVGQRPQGLRPPQGQRPPQGPRPGAGQRPSQRQGPAGGRHGPGQERGGEGRR